jgi:hypothetical protein
MWRPAPGSRFVHLRGTLVGLEIGFGGKLLPVWLVPLRSFLSSSSSCPPFLSVACSSGQR